MSLSEFQRATAEFIAAPQRCLRARTDFDAETRGFQLTDRERRRLHGLLEHPGMSVNCMLYRVNRMAPLLSTLPLTCHHLGPAVEAELTAFWQAHPDASPQYGVEARRFASWLQQRVTGGALDRGPFLDAMRFELAVFDLTTAAGAGQRWVRFEHDPQAVLGSRAAADRLPSPIWVRLRGPDPPSG